MAILGENIKFDNFDQNDTVTESQKIQKPSSYISAKPSIYISVPNSIIRYSCKHNKYFLAVYLYSWAHSQHHNDDLVETTLSIMGDSFEPNRLSYGFHNDLKQVLKLMYNGVDDNKKKGVEGFSPCIDFKGRKNNVKSNTILRYYFLGRVIKVVNDFTIITMDEYNKIVEWAFDWNLEASEGHKRNRKRDIVDKIGVVGDKISLDITRNNNDSNTKNLSEFKRGVSVFDLLNVYCYMKMKISTYKNYDKKINNNTGTITTGLSMQESIETISENFGVGKQTVAKYLKMLCDEEKLGMLKVWYFDKAGRKEEGWRRNCKSEYDLAEW